ncbi:MAG TPA: glycoside hydrolase family 15 protein [Gemmatimonadaceae bacterium]|nr:glycoside hydrolase family 15 protein [Gemmatimonadaceae bacterium]
MSATHAVPDAPGAPGDKPTWTNGNKQGIGTSATIDSKVWFTLGDGALTEVYYPTIDKANLRLLELIVTGDGIAERETTDTRHEVKPLARDVLAFVQRNTSRTDKYTIEKIVYTDPRRPVVIVDVRLQSRADSELIVSAFIDPSLQNGGLGDRAWVEDSAQGALLSAEGDIAMAVTADRGIAGATVGYAGASDGLPELRRTGSAPIYSHADNGNVTGLGRVASVPRRGDVSFRIAVAFGASAQEALAAGRASLADAAGGATLERYSAGWRSYVARLKPPDPEFADQYATAAMVLAAHEDKTHRGAMIASLTIPWGDRTDASEANVGGYHLVWSRDLYHVATAFEAMGDHDAAVRALDYLFNTQQKPDGSFPQNSWLDGRPFWGSLQLDEVAYPLVLAWQLNRGDRQTYRRHVKPAAEFLVGRGPSTPQERWEEEAGYSPSTIAAEIAGLFCAAAIADRNGDAASASRWRATADRWAVDLDRWTVTRTGPLSSSPYFIRLAQHGKPDGGEPLELNNGAGTYDERSIVDAGFLELVRLGIRRADDPLIRRSLDVIDKVIRRDTPNGPGWYRYNHDGYGEKPDGTGYDGTGVGRLWPLLTGERGEYALALGEDARPYLRALGAFGNEGRMLPEQVWDLPTSPLPSLVFGEGTGSATPLAWTNAQFIRLALGIRARHVIETPAVVRDHFAVR